MKVVDDLLTETSSWANVISTLVITDKLFSFKVSLYLEFWIEEESLNELDTSYESWKPEDGESIDMSHYVGAN